MEGGHVLSLIKAGDCIVKKKRSKLSRWPRSESFTVHRDENAVRDTILETKEFNLNVNDPKSSSINCETAEPACKRIKNGDKAFGESDGMNENSGSKAIDKKGHSGLDSKFCNDGIVRENTYNLRENSDMHSQKVDTCMDSRRSSESQSLGYANGAGSQNNIRKLKLKVGGIARIIHTNSISDGSSAGVVKPSCSLDAPPLQQKPALKDIPGWDRPPKSVNGLKGVPWKDFCGGNFSLRKQETSKDKMPRDNDLGKKIEKSESVRKSRRVPKRQVSDAGLDNEDEDEDEDDEIRYLKKLRNLKVTAKCGAKYEDTEEGSKPQRNISNFSKSRRIDHEYVKDMDISSSGEGVKKSKSGSGSGGMDYVKEEELSPNSDAKSKLQKESGNSSIDTSKEISLTRRQRALQSGNVSTSLIEFPNGLPPAPSRKQKEKLSEVEQQLKKDEAAQRRKMQMEKAAKDSEAEAIRRILGQDSSRKKREDKLKKQRDELAQERAANAHTLPPNTIRWVIGPTGTTVTFSEDVGLPSIFNAKPCSYPPPREQCAGPSCTNPYIYRDSKSKLPLCSLKCYKAIHEQANL